MLTPSLGQSQSVLSGKVTPRCSRAVHVLLGFALSQTAWLTFLDAVCVMSRLTLGIAQSNQYLPDA